MRLKPLEKQVIVITGATSGIGLATARLAAERGAKVFLIGRDGRELEHLCTEFRERGLQARCFAADVADGEALVRAAEICRDEFGGIDSWVNNAGVSVYGKLMNTPDNEARRIFETNFWGMVNGCRAAVPLLREKGGALINIGSVASEVGLPIQGFYSASKFAMKGFTDALRRELKAEGAPISVTLVKPSAIDTPYSLHAKSRLGGEPIHTPPVYAPEVVARAILACCERPIRELPVGSSAVLYPTFNRLLPGVLDFLMARFFMEKQQRRAASEKRDSQKESLFHAAGKHGETVGDYPGHLLRSSLTTELALRPWVTRSLLLSAVGGGIFAVSQMRRSLGEISEAA